MFTKYPHLEKSGSKEVEGLLDGEVFIFPKIDGTNASVWFTPEGLKAGSRNRELSLDNDNAGFYNAIIKDENVANYLAANPSHTLYGEWLVPHTLKTYEEDAWRKFYIFDVLDRDTGKFLPFDQYVDKLDGYNLNVIRPIAIVRNPTENTLLKSLERNTFLIQDGKGMGEGVVAKNYNFVNKFGRVTWLKVVTNSFKARHNKEMGAPKLENKKIVEQSIVDKYIDKHAVEKEYSKIVNENGSFENKHIPRLLNVVFYETIRDHAWDIVKDFKFPLVDYKRLDRLAKIKVKELKPELF